MIEIYRDTNSYTRKILISIFFFFLIILSVNYPANIWTEDLNTYTNDLGGDGTGSIGDYPASITQVNFTDYNKSKQQDTGIPIIR